MNQPKHKGAERCGLTRPRPNAAVRLARRHVSLRQWLVRANKSLVHSTLRWPFLPAMKDGNQLQSIAADAVGDDVWRIWHDKLSRSEDAPWPARSGLGLENINCVENSLGHERRVLLGVLRDEIS